MYSDDGIEKEKRDDAENGDDETNDLTKSEKKREMKKNVDDEAEKKTMTADHFDDDENRCHLHLLLLLLSMLQLLSLSSHLLPHSLH